MPTDTATDIDHRGEQHHGRAAVQQFADAKIGVDAGRQCEDRSSELQRDFEACDAFQQQQ
jgi:hypothetical protein